MAIWAIKLMPFAPQVHVNHMLPMYLLSNPTPPAGPVHLKKTNDLQNVFLREFRHSGQAYVMP
ncbi:MAG: hypothetical protein Q4G70_09980, partial [Pseudomonadota bacterium]|nr:hypothetical protein [Pseudomonadota bacterium]